MPCYHSLTGWQEPTGGPLTFGEHPPSPRFKRLQVPCGQCIGCRLEHSRQWAMRMILESREHQDNCFITLTYSDEHLPKDRSLDLHHVQKFHKRLAKMRGPYKHYTCGEYGDVTKRAHYHACLFGMDFPDKIAFQNKGDYTLYYSQQLTDLWGYGHTSIGDLTFETAAYCARYVLKKKTGLAKGGGLTYNLDEQTGELIAVVQPYATMSRGNRLAPNNAIGKTWLYSNARDIYGADKDFLVLQGQKMKPPKYYDKLLDKIDPERIKRIKEKREKDRKNLTIEELRAHEKNTRARIISKTKI